jgi:hypothetical protein
MRLLICVAGLGAAWPAWGQAVAARKKLIATGWDHPDPQALVENWREMEKRPFDGLVITIPGPAEDRRATLSLAFAGRPWKQEWYKPAAEQIKSCQSRRLTDNFILLGANPGDVDWFDDAGWSAVVEHWRIAAWLAKASGCKGILFDPEPYAPPHAAFKYAAQADRDKHSFDEYAAKVRQRGREVMAAVVGEYPDIVLYCYFMNSVVGSAANQANPAKLLAGQGYGLYPAFIDGWLDAVGPGVTLVDGCESAYCYNSAEQFLEATVLMKGACQLLVSPENQARYRAQVQVSFGMYLDAYWNPPTSPWYIDGKGEPRVKRLEENMRTALRCADEYVWVYGEKFRWWPTANKSVKAESWDEAIPGAEKALAFARDPIDYARQQVQTGKPANLARNGDFASEKALGDDGREETWKEGRPPAGWHAWQDDKSKGTFAWDRETGSPAKGSAMASGVAQGCLIQSYVAQPGQRYAVRAMRRVQGRGEAMIRVRWQTADGKWTAESKDVLIAADGPREQWGEMFGVAEVPAGAGKLLVLLSVAGQGAAEDVAWFDEVGVYRVE